MSYYKRPAERLLKFIRNHPNVEQMRNNPTKVLQTIDDFCFNHDFLANIGSDKGRIVTDFIAHEKPKTLVEIGGFVGYSSILFANEMRKHREGARLYSLEFDPQLAKIICEMIELAGLEETVTVVPGAGADSLRRLKKDGVLSQIDMLFLDHDEALYAPDLKVAMDELGLMKPGACIVADNVLYPGAPDYRRYVRSHNGLRSKGVKGLCLPGNVPDELEVSKVL